MTSRGAFLALWNGLDTTRVSPTEYETWHSFEHVPERVGLPGFIDARRYRRLESPGSGPQYYTCYGLQTREALATPAYREVVAYPTPWSARMRGALTDFLRLPCDLQGAHGNSSGVYVATLRLRAVDAAGMATMLELLLPALVASAAALCAHWGWAYPTNDFPLNSPGGAPADDGQKEAVVMLQHCDQGALRACTESFQRDVSLRRVTSELLGYYGLLTQVRQDELTAPLDSRQPQLPKLMQRFLSGDSFNG
jgi:hypothetical protein